MPLMWKVVSNFRLGGCNYAKGCQECYRQLRLCEIQVLCVDPQNCESHDIFGCHSRADISACVSSRPTSSGKSGSDPAKCSSIDHTTTRGPVQEPSVTDGCLPSARLMLRARDLSSTINSPATQRSDSNAPANASASGRPTLVPLLTWKPIVGRSRAETPGRSTRAVPSSPLSLDCFTLGCAPGIRSTAHRSKSRVARCRSSRCGRASATADS